LTPYSGCNQIHGTDHNPFVDIARRTNTSTFGQEDIHSIFLGDGRYLSGEKAQRLYLRKEELFDQATAYSQENTNTIDPNVSLWDWYKQAVASQGLDHEEQDQLLQVGQDWGGYVGEAIETQSLRNLWMETSLPGGQFYAENPLLISALTSYARADNLFVASSYQKILETVAQPVIGHCDLRLNAEVVSIQTLPTSDSEHRANTLIKTRGGHEDRFDQVIVTTPLGWLQKNTAAFSPPMPASLVDALASLSMGRLEKVFLHFPKAWWQHDQDGLGGQGKFATTTLFGSPEYASDTNPGKWIQEVFLYSNVAPEVAHPTMLFYIYGENSRLLTEALQGLALGSQEYHETVVSFFKPYYSRLPSYDDQDPVCRPIKVLSTDWEHDDFAGYGSYTHLATPLKDGLATIQTIRQAMGDDRGIWFAGEHAAPPNALSTIVGAYQSGEAAAKSVVALQKKQAGPAA